MLSRNFLIRLGSVSLVMILTLGSISCGPDLSTPEKTMATYYRGYMTGEKNFTEKALMGMRLENTGFNPPSVEWYKVITVQEVVNRSAFAEVGDVEIITEVQGKDTHSPEKFHYILRRYNKEWKIVSYSVQGDE